MVDREKPEDPSTAFLERLAHDLRGPLSPLQTAAYLLRRGNVEPERQEELLQIIDRQTARLSAMVQEVSDWMKVGQSRLVGNRESIEIPMLVELACAPLGAGVRLQVDEALQGHAISCDTQRLVQALSTALGFMRSRADDGVAVMSVNRTGQHVCIEVQATGFRWTSVERDALFDGAEGMPFDEGLGMRLLIAHAIARGHGGDMVAADSPEGWACIRLLLPSGD